MKVLREQLALLVEVVGSSLIKLVRNLPGLLVSCQRYTHHVNEGVQRTLPVLDQLSGIVLLPLLLVITQVSGEGLLTPGAVDGVGDGRERADTLEHAGVLEVQRQGAVAAHGVAADGDPRRVKLLECAEDEAGQLLGQVRLHLVVGAPGIARGVDVEAGGAAKVPAVVLAGQVEAARGRVRVQQGEAERRGVGVQETLVGDIVGRAGQAGEVDEERRGLGSRGGRRQVEGQVHGRAGGGGLVGELQESTAEAGDGGVGGECGRHGDCGCGAVG